MANVKTELRVRDEDIERLNFVGLSQKAIADRLGCHAATVALRMRKLKLKKVDTRHSFMEVVFNKLSLEQQDWLTDRLFSTQTDIHTFVAALLGTVYEQEASLVPTPATKAVKLETVELEGGENEDEEEEPQDGEDEDGEEDDTEYEYDDEDEEYEYEDEDEDDEDEDE